jgi:ABC-type branched-subunit amino acid transport system permease subunit
MKPISKILLASIVITALLLAAGLVAPKWPLFLATLSASHGLAILGVVVLTRGGRATFGQGLFFAIGAYVAALVSLHMDISDAVLRALLGTLAAAAVVSKWKTYSPSIQRYWKPPLLGGHARCSGSAFMFSSLCARGSQSRQRH